MNVRFMGASLLPIAAVMVLGFSNVAAALSVSCNGIANGAAVTWSANVADGIAPFSLLWGTGATTTPLTQTLAPGAHTMTIQATDASSTIATSTCAATVAPLPTVASFTATPASIIAGQSSILAWNVSNASSTSVSGIGTVTGATTTVSPTATTVYTLTAVNPSGTSTAQATVTVTATSSTSTTTPGIVQQIQTLLAQIKALQQQLAQLLSGQIGTGTGTTTPPIFMPGNGNSCLSLARNLKFGDSGNDVMSLQRFLALDALNGFSGTPTGFFGPATMRAVIKFQIRNGIASSTDGTVGPRTRTFFSIKCKDSNKSSLELRVDDRGSSTSVNATIDNRGTNRGNSGKGKNR